MSEQSDKVINSLVAYGLTSDEAQVYLELLGNETLSALQISRNIHMGRTKVYRIIDKLINKELVVQKPSDLGLTFIADPPSQLDILLSKKEGEIKSLRTNLPNLIKNLDTHIQPGSKSSQVLFYRGEKGLSQVNWHLLRAKKEFLSYEVDNAEAYLTKQESEELRRKLVEKKISIRSLTNLTRFDAFTQVPGMINLWQAGHIDKETLNISADIFIYNNVYTVVNYLSKKDIFCVEIYNENLANMQRQLFEVLWESAKKFKMLNSFGSAQV